jgi:RNA polymerase sigma factor (sigma-70 family)
MYWPALYAWLRRERHSPADAEDLVQGFLCRFLARNDFAQAQAERGRFRSYLLGGLQHYIISEIRRDGAAKRGGGDAHVSLDELRSEEIAGSTLPPDLSAQEAFDRRWLMAILAEALRQLENDYVAAGQQERFRALQPWLTSDPPDGTYDVLAEKLGVVRPTIATWVSRLRARYRDLVQAQIRETVSSQEEMEHEVRELLAVL